MNNTITGYTWDFPGGMTGLCIAAAIGLLLIVSSYSFTLKKLRLRWRIIFILLRTAAFAALLYCLCNPRIETRRRVNETRGRRIAVFTDESGSMQKQNYWKRSRLQDAIRFLDENPERNDPNYEYSFFRFSDTVRKIGNPAENATKKKASTHLFELIAAQTPHLEAEQFDGAVYLTDGIDTSGSADAENAFSALATSKMKHLFVPVTTALTAPPSLALRKIEAPTLAFDGTDNGVAYNRIDIDKGGWFSLPLQSDSATALSRLYGYIVLPEQSVREKVYIDSLMLIRKHYNDRILDVNNQVYMPEQSVVSGESKKAVAKRVTKLKKLGS